MTHELKELSPKHKDAMSLLAQGVDRATVANICGFVPEYVTWLQRQPVCRVFIAEMNEANETRLEALFDKSVDAIASGLQQGTVEERLKAARLQMEATKRLGKQERVQEDSSTDRLEQLAERLLALQARTITQGATYEGEATRVQQD